ncbi:MAG: acetyl-CoA carboxylase biotin carboxyl carrier protein subunit [Candidatus Heimdallarchaeota archaeon]|nr:acetyl-CoA carboxylase biotin carboxyl carrier protein subunit [Candidatus Heimdallarchaeota archaeon]
MSQREHRTVKVEAPIPGKIVQILVKKGDKIAKDQELIILEAMKMRNRILAKQSGEISEIKVKEGDMVKQDQILVIIE